MEIAAGICTYASPHLLRRCLESLQGLTDFNIVVHGRFKGFPWVMPHAESLLCTLRIIENYRGLILVDMPDDPPNKMKTQMQHRNEYLKAAKKEGIDWMLVIDDDDYVITQRSDFVKLRHELEQLQEDEQGQQTEQQKWYLYNVPCVQTEDEQLPARYVWHRPRLLLDPGRFTYLDTAHYHLKDPVGRIYKGHPGHAMIQHLYLRHDQDDNDELRLKEYMNAKRKYMAWQKTNEKD